MNQRIVAGLCSCAALLVWSLGTAQVKQTYKLAQVGTNDSTTSTFVIGMDDEGVLGLTVSTASNTNVYLWRHGTMTNIGGLAPSPSFVEGGALNDFVQVAASTPSPQTGESVAFIWQFGRATPLPSPPNTTAVFTSAINLLGQVVGQAYDQNFIPHVVLWNRRQPSLLAGLPDAQFVQPVGINIRGDIVGTSFDANEVPTGLLWRKGVLTSVVPGVEPNGLNDRGQIVGFASGSPFIWEGSKVTRLPLIGGSADTGSAEAINIWGQIVGSETTAAGLTEALLWQGSGASVADLNTLISKTDPLRPYVTLASGMLINNLGQIVATGNDSRNPDFQQYYLLSPRP
jgi:uncharacterized membrane protein